MKTDKCEFTIGVNPRYYEKHRFFHNMKYYIEGIINTRKFISRIQTTSKFVLDTTGIYVSWNVAKQRTVYAPTWGCPPRGERAYVLSAVRNPIFDTDSDKWKHAVTECITALKKLNKQVTVSVTFSKVDFQYFVTKPTKEDNSKITENYYVLITLPEYGNKRTIGDVIEYAEVNTKCEVKAIETVTTDDQKIKSPAQVIVDEYTNQQSKNSFIYRLSITSKRNCRDDCSKCILEIINALSNIGYDGTIITEKGE